jgi:hypothetical protein
MPDLETLVRDVRPEPNPAWVARLDARAAAHFPTPPPKWKRPLIAMGEHLIAFSAAGAMASVLIVVIVAGVKFSGGAGDSDSAGGASSTSAKVAPESETSAGESAGDNSADSSAPQARKSKPSTGATPLTATATPLADQARAVLRNASITLSTRPDQVESVTDRAIRLVDSLGGFVASSEISRSGSSATSTITLNIPSGKLDVGLAQLSKLAHVSSRSQQAQDVTDQREALESAVRDARADRDGLRARLAKATTDKERSRLRGLLDRATRRVTQRQRRVNELGAAVSYATVELSVEGNRRSGAVADPGDRWTPGDAAGDAVRVLEVIAGVLVIALAILLPVAIVIALAAYASRLLTRRRRERALEAT